MQLSADHAVSVVDHKDILHRAAGVHKHIEHRFNLRFGAADVISAGAGVVRREDVALAGGEDLAAGGAQQGDVLYDNLPADVELFCQL